MSNRRRNNHYHYAEKFDDNKRRRDGKKVAYMPFKSVVITLVVLLMFGLISTTFAVFVSENSPEYDPAEDTQSLIVNARNLKASRDVAMVGADFDIASTGANISNFYPIIDLSDVGWTGSYVYCLIGTSSASYPYALTKIANTDLWGVSSGITYNGATEFCFINTTSSWSGSENSSPTNRRAYASKRTDIYNVNSNMSSVYVGTLSGSSNPYHYSKFDSVTNGYSAFNYTQTIKSYTSNDGSSYSSDNTGGSIAVSSAYKLNGNASSTSSSPSNGTFSAAKTSTVKLSATASTGYRFVGWYNSSNTQLSTNSTYSYTVTGEYEVRARFIKRNTVTTKRGSGFNGTAPTPATTTVDAGTQVELKATTPDGVSFNGWTFNGSKSFVSGYNASSNPCKIVPSATVTATATYSLTAPTISSFSYTTKVVGQTSEVSKSATSAAGTSGNLSYSYTIAPASGTTAAPGTYSVDSLGTVSASVPGNYTVTMTVTDTAYGLTATKTQTATATFMPAAPTPISFVVDGSTNNDAAGTNADPYLVPIKSDPTLSKFKVRAFIPESDRISGYTYSWTVTDGSLSMTYGSASQSVPDILDEAKNYSSGSTNTCLKVSSAGNYYFKASLVATCNGVSSLPTDAKIYYNVITNFLNVDSYQFSNDDEEESLHKIYSSDNDITKINTVYDTGLSSFDTVFFFSGDNLTYSPLEVWTAKTDFKANGVTYTPTPNDSDHQVNSLITKFNVAVKMGYSGVKYFKSYIASGDPNVVPLISKTTDVLHTTVGTTSAGSNKPLYFVNNSGQTFVDTRLMAFFIDSSDKLRYQTAQQIDANTYRFFVPTDAVSVTFSYAASNYYILPTSNNGVISYTPNSNVYKAWSPTINLAENYGKNVYKATSATLDSNSIYQFTGNMTSLE